MSDREYLRAFARHPCAENFRPFLERYLAFVYSSARRQVGDEAQAAEVTRAVFLALAYKARKLPRKTVLAGWLLRATAFASLKLTGRVRHPGWLRSLWRKTTGWLRPGTGRGPVQEDRERNCAPGKLDDALNGLPSKQRDAVLLQVLLNFSWEETARILRTSERRARNRVRRGLAKLTKRLRKHGFPIEWKELVLACSSQGCPTPAPELERRGAPPPGAPVQDHPSPDGPANSLPEGLALEVLTLVEEGLGRRPSVKLARRTLRAIYWAPWRRRIKIAAICLSVFILLATIVGFYLTSLWRSGRLMAWLIEFSAVHPAKTVAGLAQPARPWPTDPAQPRLRADSIQKAADLFQTTNVWLAQLKFWPEQWKSLEPTRVDPVPSIFQPDGTVLLRNPKAQRSGLAGILGYDFNWARGDLDFGGTALSNVGARFKGNGTYIGSLYGPKRSFKVDFKKFGKGQQLGGVEEINFTNLIDDRSYMSDALAYELFREAGVPAPRTAYAWLAVTVPGQWERKPLGLYLLVENLGGGFAAERFGSKKTPIFKPVTYQLFEDLGGDWSAYASIYDLKTRATAEQRARVVEFSRFVSGAGDLEFAKHVGDFLDLDEFARFLGCLVLLSSYDGFLSDGQNFYVYLHPNSDKFGFIPWDLDHAWGGFYLTATPEERERASIWHPWLGRNRLLERVMAVEEFRQIYRARLEELLTRLFVPNRLSQRIDEIAQVIRSPIAAESAFRLERFDQAVSAKWLPRSHDGDRMGPDRPVHQLKRFVETRAKSVRQQLDGKSKGMILKRRED